VPATPKKPSLSIVLVLCYAISISCPTPSSSWRKTVPSLSGRPYRYLQQAQRLKEPLTVSESKLAFTVKLPASLIQRVRLYASVKNLSISEVVSRALLALLPRGRGRG